MVYWKVSGMQRDNHVLCHTKQTSCQFGVSCYQFLFVSSGHNMTIWLVFGKAQLSRALRHVSRFLSALLIPLHVSLMAPVLDKFWDPTPHL